MELLAPNKRKPIFFSSRTLFLSTHYAAQLYDESWSSTEGKLVLLSEYYLVCSTQSNDKEIFLVQEQFQPHLAPMLT